ncbi:MAG: hypothetical protein A2V62_04855 [Nitrospirae bacterium RBG_19FT_COMBO_58_9]|nr:MAG: hypothetical protein A2V62_04855 [Nitrospirae bacterium RBG_19FT_COMBO_58_9]
MRHRTPRLRAERTRIREQAGHVRLHPVHERFQAISQFLCGLATGQAEILDQPSHRLRTSAEVLRQCVLLVFSHPVLVHRHTTTLSTELSQMRRHVGGDTRRRLREPCMQGVSHTVVIPAKPLQQPHDVVRSGSAPSSSRVAVVRYIGHQGLG